MFIYSIGKLLEITNGKLLKGQDLSEKFAISTDTRTITGENIFLPLSGENFNGHDFINTAINRGCRAYFTSKNGLSTENNADYAVFVENTLEAYLKIANHTRKTLNPTVIAITGSSGKTTVKEFIYSVLATSFPVHKSLLNHNNEIGLCQTLLSVPENTRYVVMEMGMRGPGEIELLSKWAEPDIAVITNIGTAHIGRLGSMDNIAKAKCEITKHLKPRGIFLAPKDDLIAKHCEWRGNRVFFGEGHEITRQEEDLTGFTVEGEHFEIPVMGEYNVINAIVAIKIGKLLGISSENIRQGLLNYRSVGDRGKITRLKNGTRLITDCYNANPQSVMAAVDSVVNTCKGSRIILVLGDMAELGEHEDDLHREVGRFVSQKQVDLVVTVGEKAKLIADMIDNPKKKRVFASNAEAAEFLRSCLEAGSVVLLKGSRVMKLEEICNMI